MLPTLNLELLENDKGFSFKNIREFKEQLLINVNDTVLTYPISIKLSIHDVKDFKLIKNSRLAALDYSKLHFPLILRPWQKGDVFIPIRNERKEEN